MRIEPSWENDYVVVWAEIDIGIRTFHSPPLVLGRLGDCPRTIARRGRLLAQAPRRSETDRFKGSSTRAGQGWGHAMKYLMLFILGALPLAVQTGLCGWNLAREDEESLPPPLVRIAPGGGGGRPPSPRRPSGIPRGTSWRARRCSIRRPRPPCRRALRDGVEIGMGAIFPRLGNDRAAVQVLRRSIDGDYAQLTAALQEMQSFAAEHDLADGEKSGRLRTLSDQEARAVPCCGGGTGRPRRPTVPPLRKNCATRLFASPGRGRRGAQAAELKKAAMLCNDTMQARADLAAIGQPRPATLTTESIDLLKRRQERLRQLLETGPRPTLRADEARFPSTSVGELNGFRSAKWRKSPLKSAASRSLPRTKNWKGAAVRQEGSSAKAGRVKGGDTRNAKTCAIACFAISRTSFPPKRSRTSGNRPCSPRRRSGWAVELDRIGEPPQGVDPAEGISLLKHARSGLVPSWRSARRSNCPNRGSRRPSAGNWRGGTGNSRPCPARSRRWKGSKRGPRRLRRCSPISRPVCPNG